MRYGVVQREARNNVLDLVIDSDYDGNLAASKVESGLHHYLRQGIGIGGATISNTSMQQDAGRLIFVHDVALVSLLFSDVASAGEK